MGASLALSMLMFSNFASAQATGDDALTAKATAAIRQECGATGALTSSGITTIGICFVDGFLKRVEVISKGHCPSNEPCLIKPVYYGYVDFDCDGNVMNVVCAN